MRWKLSGKRRSAKTDSPETAVLLRASERIMRIPHLIVSSIVAAATLTAVRAGGAGSGPQAPEIKAATWINTPSVATTMKGHVTLVEFWTFGCFNCRNVEPHVREWHSKYSGRGLAVIGVHTPETAYERDVDNVKRYVREHHIEHPIAIDGDATIWQRYGNDAWPTWYLVDKHGIIRHKHVGEGAYTDTEREIEALLAEP